MMNNLTYYDVLHVQPNVEAGALRAAYLRLAKLHHPDANPTDRHLAAARFRLIQEAYDTLRDPHQRRAYDDTLRAQAWMGPRGPGNDNTTHVASDVMTRTRTTLERLMRMMAQSRHMNVTGRAQHD